MLVTLSVVSLGLFARRAHIRDEAAPGLELFGGPAQPETQRSRLEHCAGGTIYLDDLSALPPRLQLKLLDFVQSGSFEREETFDRVSVDVRLIAGAGPPLAALTQAGLFRQDLFYAFSAKAIDLPPLRERMEDFQKLAVCFAAFYCRQNGREYAGLTGEAKDYLKAYPWPGNLRELRNVVERAVLQARSGRPDGAIGSARGEGSVFTIRLPRAAASLESPISASTQTGANR